MLTSLNRLIGGEAGKEEWETGLRKLGRRLTMKRKEKRRTDYKTRAIPNCLDVLPYADATVSLEKRTHKSWLGKEKWELRFCVIRDNSLYLYRNSDGLSTDPETQLFLLSRMDFASKVHSHNGKRSISFCFVEPESGERLKLRPFGTADFLFLSGVFGRISIRPPHPPSPFSSISLPLDPAHPLYHDNCLTESDWTQSDTQSLLEDPESSVVTTAVDYWKSIALHLTPNHTTLDGEPKTFSGTPSSSGSENLYTMQRETEGEEEEETGSSSSDDGAGDWKRI